jgi:hypothetical protein
MRVISVFLLLLSLGAGCARKAPETPEPTPPTTAPQTSKPATPQPATPTANGKPAAPSAKPPAAKPSPAKPAPTATATKPAPATKPVPAPKPAPPAAAAPKSAPSAPPRTASRSPSLDLEALKERLKATKAIGVFTKLTLKNQVDDLLDDFRDHYAGKGNVKMPQLRQSYDLLMMKVLSLLQDDDQKLASDIVASREAIWGLLSDPKKFAALDV